jgi:hypothetical protein
MDKFIVKQITDYVWSVESDEFDLSLTSKGRGSEWGYVLFSDPVAAQAVADALNQHYVDLG